MPKFSKKSLQFLEEAHPDLQKIFSEIIKICDCTITDSYRDEERQTKLFETCKTHIKWPHSKHNSKPSHAVDVVPKNVNLDNSESTIKQTHYFAGQVVAIAAYLYEQKIITSRLVWGGGDILPPSNCKATMMGASKISERLSRNGSCFTGLTNANTSTGTSPVSLGVGKDYSGTKKKSNIFAKGRPNSSPPKFQSSTMGHKGPKLLNEILDGVFFGQPDKKGNLQFRNQNFAELTHFELDI